MSLLFALPRLIICATALAHSGTNEPSPATRLAMRSAYAWQATSVELAVEAGNYPVAKEYAEGLQASLLQGWEAGYYGAKLAEGYSRLDPHGGPLGAARYSPDGRYIATPAAWNNGKLPGVCYLWTATGHLVAALKDVRELAFSPNSRYLITTDLEGKKATVSDVESGMPIKYIGIDGESTLRAVENARFLVRSYPQNAFTWVDFGTTGASHKIYIPTNFWEVSPDGKYTLTYAYGKSFTLLSTDTGKPEVELSVPKMQNGDLAYTHIAFSADSSKFAASFQDGTCAVWSVSSGKLLHSSGSGWQVRFLKFSPDASRLMVQRDDRALRVLDASTGKELASVYPPNEEGPYRGELRIPEGIALSPDNKRLMCIIKGGLASVWDFPVTPNRAHLHADNPTVLYWADDEVTDPNATLMGHREQTIDAEFSPDGRSIATTSTDGTLMIWPSTGTDPVEQLRGHEWEVKGATFSPDGKLAVTVSLDDTAKVWNAETGRLVATLSGHQFAVNSAVFSHDGSKLVTGSQDGTAIVWRVATWAHQVLSGHKYSVTSAVFSPDDKHVLTASQDGTAAVWNASTGAREFALKGHKFAVNSAAYSKDGKWILTASADSTAAIWSAATGQRVHVLTGHKYPINAASFSNDGRWVVTASADGTARIWSCATGSVVRVLDAHGLELTSAAFSPSGWQVVTASKDGSATVWTARTGQPFVTLRGHEAGITSVSFSPDGQRILTSSEDSTARVWDAVTGRQMALLDGHLYGVNSAAFSADGRKIITASKDCSARIWYSYGRVVSR